MVIIDQDREIIIKTKGDFVIERTFNIESRLHILRITLGNNIYNIAEYESYQKAVEAMYIIANACASAESNMVIEMPYGN